MLGKDKIQFFHIGHKGEITIREDPYSKRIEFWNKLPLMELDYEIENIFKKQKDEL